jgi:subtilisin family serine protease
MVVLSAMAGNIPGELIGSAPEANYILIRSEDANSEQIIEEYNWAAAAELADSLGVDIINSSLGYYVYDAPWQSYDYTQLDGKTTPAARAANFASEKGILVVVSAGNEGETDWEHINTPADAFGVIAVGAVNEFGQYVSFSSTGPSADGRIKPDVVAMGVRTVIQSPTGQVGSASGTSLSAPIISGLAACLWQALPSLTVKELTQRMIQYSSNSMAPNNQIGYGLPDFAFSLNSVPQHPNGKHIHLYPNPTRSVVHIYLPKPLTVNSSVQIITTAGIVVKKENILSSSIVHTLHIPEKYPSGFYLIKLITGNESMTGRVIKTNYGIE